MLTLARLHRTALEHLGVRGQPKLTGRRGIQIWIPITRGPTFAETRAWVEQLSRTVSAVVPELVRWVQSWGADVDVLAPTSLDDTVLAEARRILEKAARRYNVF